MIMSTNDGQKSTRKSVVVPKAGSERISPKRFKRRPLVMANWKMHLSSERVASLMQSIVDQWRGVHQCEVVVCPPYPYLQTTLQWLGESNIALGAQNFFPEDEGAYTGEVSGDMLLDLGCEYVLCGHSERRHKFGEKDSLIARKFKKAVELGLKPVLCLGETEAQHESGRAHESVLNQLLRVVDHCGLPALAKGVVAYEPLWAIGTGKTASPVDAQEMHSLIRESLGPEGDQIRILYGGSVKPENAAALMAQTDIDGALVGGAALDADSFIDICRAAE